MFGRSLLCSMEQADAGMSSFEENLQTILEGCRSGRTLVVAASLVEMTKKRRKEILVTQRTDESDQAYTPFLLSVRKEHIHLVRLFLTMFSINPNDKCHAGNLSFDGHMVDGATPLWCAAAVGNYDMVRLLLEHGAQINQCTESKSSPLRASCFAGNMLVVQHLIENGADIEIANAYNNTCLMVASYRGHLQIVQYLLDSGAQVNRQDNSESTAMHFAIDGSRLDIVKELVDKGGDITKLNGSDLTPPMSAADNCNAELVEYFCGLDSIPTLDKINLIELLGASYANDKDYYDIEKTYNCFSQALSIRERENLPKITQPPVEEYLFKKEFETQAELDEIFLNDMDALHIEALIVRERILGSDNVEIPHPIIYRGAVFADRLQFSKCISLWRRALYLKQKNSREVYCDICRFAEVFSQMYLLREEIEFESLAFVLVSCLEELQRTRGKLSVSQAMLHDPSSPPIHFVHHCPHMKLNTEQEIEILQARLDGNVLAMLYLLFVLVKTPKQASEHQRCGRIVYNFVRQDFRDKKGRTPLHQVLDQSTPVDEFHVRDICSFPNSDIARLLLSCGADPNAMCKNGNTPLHLIVQYAKPISDHMTLQTAIKDLLEAGAHPDTRNLRRQSPLDLATTGVAEKILGKEATWSLKCFAARVVRKYNIPYIGEVPVSLEKFIEMH